MEMRIVGWRCSNIRGNLRDIEIDLTTSPPRWTLIQMNNGGGKTTTMALIRAALTAEKLSVDQVRGLRPDDGASVGSFQLRILIDGRLHIVTINFDYPSGAHSYSTARTNELGGGLVDMHALPSDVRRLMTPEFAELFVFDGELARKIRSHSSDRASTAIETLYGLDRVAALGTAIERLLKDRQNQVATVTQARDARWLSRIKNELDKALERLAALEGQRDLLKGDRGLAVTERDRLNKEIGDRIGQNKDAAAELGALADDLNNANLVIMGETNTLRTSLQSPFLASPKALARLRALSAQLQSLRLPETASAEFFHDLAEDSHCLCGEAITPVIKDRIKARAATFMGAAESGLINSLKTMVRTTEDDPAQVREPVEILRGRVRERHKIKQSYDTKYASYIAEGGEALTALKDEADKQEREIGRLDEQLLRLESADLTYQLTNGLGWEQNIPKCKAHVSECEDRYNTATDTHKLLQQSRITQKILGAIKDEALGRLREKIRVSTNLKLGQLVPAEKLEVVRIGSALELASGTLSSKDNVSEGQSLSIAYAFLASLFEQANHRLPFIIDSPAVPLDAEMRREVIKVVPGLFEQTIMFVLSTERQDFAEAFYGRDGARFITLVREPDGGAEQLEGEEAFKTFQDDTDPAVEELAQ